MKFVHKKLFMLFVFPLFCFFCLFYGKLFMTKDCLLSYACAANESNKY